MRKKRHFFATHGALTGQGASKSEASADLERQIDWALQLHSPHIESRFGFVIVIAATCSGWESRLIGPEQIAAHGKVHICSMMCGNADLAQLIQGARVHAAQNAWHAGADDADIIARAGTDRDHTSQLESWIRFQRQYLANKAAGMTDGEAFEKAR